MDIKARDRILKSIDIVRQLESRPDVVALAAAELSKSFGLEAVQASENRAVMSLDGLLSRAIDEFVGMVGKGEVAGMTVSGDSAIMEAQRAAAAKACSEMLSTMRQQALQTVKHEIHEVEARNRYFFLNCCKSDVFVITGWHRHSRSTRCACYSLRQPQS